jgi:hypothetical protein
MNIFEITAKAKELALALESGELTPDLENELVINQTDLQAKAVDYAYVIKGFEADIDAISNEIKRLSELKKAKENAIDRMKQSVENAFEVYGITEVKTPTLKLSLRRSESIEVAMAELLPESYLVTKTTVSADKVKIKNAIKSGEVVPGAVLVENYNLQIK